MNEPLVHIQLTNEDGDILAQKEALGFESAQESLGKLEEWYKNYQGELEAKQELAEEDGGETFAEHLESIKNE